MKIAGLQKVSLIDYPGYIAATVFIAGCNLNCLRKMHVLRAQARGLTTMGRGQAVRRGTLDPVFEGSNPSAPANSRGCR